MTGQAYDTLLWKGDRWAVLSAGPGLFDPKAYDVKPEILHTGAWLGYLCTYAVREDVLHLDRVEMALDHASHEKALAAEGPRIHDRVPQRSGTGNTWVYEGLAMPLPFNGTITAGRDFVQELYVHMGYQPSWKYRDVHELRFDNGRLVTTEDKSELMAQMRAWELKKRAPVPPGRRGLLQKIADWIRVVRR